MKKRVPQFSVHAIVATLLVIAYPVKAQKPNHGIFVNDWKAKEFIQPASVPFKGVIKKNPDVQANIDYSKKLNKVSRYLSGINSTIYTGNYLEDTILVNFLSRLKPGIIRFPGGDASNMYFWNGLPNDWSEKVEVNGQTNVQNAKGGPETNFAQIPAWSKTLKEGINIDIKGLSVIYLLVEGN